VKRRLFVAAELDEATRSGCAALAERLRAKRFEARFVVPPSYHLTLAFLGGVDEERLGEISAALRDVAPSLAPLALTIDTVGAFPDRRRPRIVWAGPAGPVPAFATACGVVRSALVAHGFSFDRHADPHVTLARSDGRSALPALEAPHALPLAIDALTLFESHTAPSGARYDALERFQLG
jgi:2'-5' RNA ligase